MKRCDFCGRQFRSHPPPAFSQAILPEALQGELPHSSGLFMGDRCSSARV
jgi:hypothetical protein